MKNKNIEFTGRTEEAQFMSDELLNEFSKLLPQFGVNWHRHSLVGLKVESLARVLYYAELYKKIITVPGVVCEFGVQWGATLVELVNLRSIFEPFNNSRIIYGFDTFQGFPSVSDVDGEFSKVGDYSSVSGYELVLERILDLHEKSAPMNNFKKYELIKGDVSTTFELWLRENPHSVISMAIFDMDLYKPTYDVLKALIPRLTKGSLLIFDELNCKHFPGETVALKEVLGLNNIRLHRSPYQPYCSWLVWGD